MKKAMKAVLASDPSVDLVGVFDTALSTSAASSGQPDASAEASASAEPENEWLKVFGGEKRELLDLVRAAPPGTVLEVGGLQENPLVRSSQACGTRSWAHTE